MKKYIKQISLLVLFVVFASCTNDTGDHNTMPSASGRPVLGKSSNPTRVADDSKFERANIGQPIYIYTFLKEGVTLKSLVVYNTVSPSGPVVISTKVADAKVDGATSSFNSSALSSNPAFDPSLTVSKTIRLAFVATFSDGLTLTNGAVLTVTP